MHRGRIRALAAVAVLIGAGPVVASCGGGETVAGKPTQVSAGQRLTHIATPLARLAPEPSRFPSPYSAVALPPEAVAQAAADLTGVGRHGVVRPAECTPPAQRFGPDDTVVVVGTDAATRRTLSVQLTRVDRPLTERRDQLTRCLKATVTSPGAQSTLTSRLQPPPPVDADDVIAVDQTVESHGGGPALRQSMQTLVAQVGDVRVSATQMSFGASPEDAIGGGDEGESAAIDTLFTDTVVRLRKSAS
ncbi:MAG: sensor domain-containing protein [Mycobacteriaceae bacterium]|nr:sensor domain-containing protein [Mycobacteriaceae bacterium]